MCGLVGVITRTSNGFFNPQLKALDDLLFVDQLRGEDATGLALVNKQHGATILKEASNASLFCLDKQYDELTKEAMMSGKALLGHNRKATIGKKVDENAHPFVYDDRYVFFHNGTLHSHKHIKDTEVDSEALGWLLTGCEGDKEKLETALGKVHGAYATVWYDSNKNTVYFLRNAERSLYYTIAGDGTFFYASEWWMLHMLTRHQFKIDKIEAVPINTLLSIDLSENNLTIVETKLEKKVQAVTGMGNQWTKPTHTPITVEPITKKAGKQLITQLGKLTSITFVADRFIPQVPADYGELDETQTYDWVIVGSNDAWPGCIFRGKVKNCYPIELEELVQNPVVTATILEAEWDRSKIYVLTESLKWKKSWVN